eukprot:XP_011672430.1 PREDICTED: cytochrome P450 4g15-like [Strongylocentrotus purpuratus]
MALWNLAPVSVLVLSVLFSFLGYRCLLCMIAVWTEVKRIVHIRRTLPGAPPHWLFGNILQEPGPVTPGFEWHRNMPKTYRRLCVFWIGWKPIVILNHPESVRNVLNDRVGTVKSDVYRLFDEWLGDGLVTTDGKVWKRHRKLITNSFHFNVLKSYIPKMNQIADTLISVISQRGAAGELLELHKTTSAFSSDVILQCAFSYESGCQEGVSEYMKSSDVYRLFDEWLGDGLVTTDGKVWKRHRRLITNSFHFNVLKSYIHKMNQIADTLISVISQRGAAGELLELHKTTSAFSSDVILQCAFSYESGCQEGVSEYMKSLSTLGTIFMKRSLSPPLLYDFIFRRSSLYKSWRKEIDVLHRLQEKLISDRREQHRQTGCTEFSKGMDFLDTLMLAKDAEGGLTDREMRDEVSI